MIASNLFCANEMETNGQLNWVIFLNCRNDIIIIWAAICVGLVDLLFGKLWLVKLVYLMRPNHIEID